MNPVERTVESCIDRPWLVLLAWSIAAGVLAVGAASIRVDNSPESFLPTWSDAYSDYERFREQFGGEEIVRVVFEAREAWDVPDLSRIGELERRLASIESVIAVAGPLSVSEAFGPVVWPPDDARNFVERLRRSPIARGLGIISSDGRHLSLLVALGPVEPQAGRRVLADLESAVRYSSRSPSQGVESWLAGPPFLDRALDEAAGSVQSRQLPAIAAACMLLLFVVFRCWRRVVLPLLFVAATELAVAGPLGWLGVRLDLVLGVLPPLVLVIALATALHVMLRFDAHLRGGTSHREAVRAAMFEKSGALVWMGVTTAAGFGSLVTSRVGPVRSFGAWAAWAALVMTLAALTLFPALLATVGRSRGPGRVPGSSGAGRGIPRVLRVPVSGGSWAGWAVRMRPFVLVAAALAAALALGGLARLRTETNALTYLRPEHPARAAIERTERAGLGLSSIELLVELRPGAGSKLDDPRSLDSLSRLEDRLREIPGVISVAGPVGMVDAIAAGRTGADSDAARRFALAAVRADPRGADAVGRFLAPGGESARLTVFVPMAGSERIDPLVGTALSEAVAALPGARLTATGRLPLLLETQSYLLRTLVVSFTLTLVSVAAVFRLLLGSTRMTLVAVVPNVWPVLGVFGLMGWTGVPLDVGTVMVAAIALGLVVDDTIHTLAHFRMLEPRVGRLSAVRGTLEATAPAYMLTALVLIAGFSVLGAASFLPTARFGVLCAVATALALLSDLLLLPALLGGSALRPARPSTGSASN